MEGEGIFWEGGSKGGGFLGKVGMDSFYGEEDDLFGGRGAILWGRNNHAPMFLLYCTFSNVFREMKGKCRGSKL